MQFFQHDHQAICHPDFNLLRRSFILVALIFSCCNTFAMMKGKVSAHTGSNNNHGASLTNHEAIQAAASLVYNIATPSDEKRYSDSASEADEEKLNDHQQSWWLKRVSP